MRNTRNPKSKLRFSAVILFLFVGLLLCSLSLKVFAQEKKSGIVAGRVIVKFKYDEIEFPEGESKVDIGRVNVRSATLKQALQRFKVGHFSQGSTSSSERRYPAPAPQWRFGQIG